MASNLKLVESMDTNQIEKSLEKFEDRLDKRLSGTLKHHDEVFAAKFLHIETRMQAQNEALVRVGEIVQRAGEANVKSISASQEAMVSQTRILMDGNKESLNRVHMRLDEIKNELTEGSKKFVELHQRISTIERLVFGGGSLLAAGIATLAFKVLGGN